MFVSLIIEMRGTKQASFADVQEYDGSAEKDTKSKHFRHMKLVVLVILCLQNSIFTVLRRYSQGVLRETYSKHEVLLFGEVVKIVFSGFIILRQQQSSSNLANHMCFLLRSSGKMFILSLIYGLMNILSYIALRNVSAGIFTICAQLKIFTTATFSTMMLEKNYSSVKWRALLSLVIGVLLFSEPTWNTVGTTRSRDDGHALIGIAAVLIEVTLSGFASIYFEKVIKTDAEQLNIWERNFQLGLGSVPVYIVFILQEGGGDAGYFGGWSFVTFVLGCIGAGGGLLVALSIKYGDSILKTLATTGSIILSSILDHLLMDGPLTPTMVLAGGIVITAIFDYSFDPSPSHLHTTTHLNHEEKDVESMPLMKGKTSH